MENINKSFNVRRGDVYILDLGGTVGSEQGGARPYCIIQGDVGNRFSPTVIVSAITSQQCKADLPVHVELSTTIGLEKNSVCLLEQVRTIDKKRLVGARFVARLRRDDLNAISEAISISMGITYGNEKEPREQADEVKYWVRQVRNLISYDNIPEKIILESIERLRYEYLKLENTCTRCRTYVDRFFTEDISEFTSEYGYKREKYNNKVIVNMRESKLIAL